MKTIEEKELREKVLSIEPKKLYFADYSIDNNGKKTKGSVVLKGEDLTENQIKNCEPFNV